MAFNFDEQWIYNGQLIVSQPLITPTALGVGPSKVKWSSYIQGPLQTGQVGAFGSATATQMVGRTDTISTPLAINTRGNVTIEGDGGTANGLKLSGGSSVDALYVNGDVLYFKTDGGTVTNLLAGGGGTSRSPRGETSGASSGGRGGY